MDLRSPKLDVIIIRIFSQSLAVASTIFFDMQKSVVEKWGKLNFLKVVALVHLILFSMIMLKIE